MTLMCPHCGQQDRQVKAGTTGGVQRYKCMMCSRGYSLDTRPRAYASATRDRAIDMHAAGTSIRKIARDLSISPQTVCNWISAAPAKDAPPISDPLPAEQAARQRNTIADVARRAGVSTSTVSNYLNDKGRMSEETRRRIGAAIKELYFTPNALVRAIRNRRIHTIGLVSYGIYELTKSADMSPVTQMLGAINRAADEASYDVLLYTGWPHRARSREGSDFLNGQIDGLLWMSPQQNNSQLRFAAAAGLPVMSMLTRRVPDNVGYVVSDNIGAIRDIVVYLAGLGHTRIAFLGSTMTSDFIDRAEGYREGLERAEIAYDPDIEITTLGTDDWSIAAISPILDKWLVMDDRPTAIVAVEDLLASYVIESVRERGLRVPGDIAVTGFNDIAASAHLSGGITTVRQPFVEVGRIAVERLNAMIHGAPASECRLTVPTSMVIRASTEQQVI